MGYNNAYDSPAAQQHAYDVPRITAHDQKQAGCLDLDGSRMTQHFNPAPGWPAPPAGWLPPKGWTPDASWPPAPKGWQVLLDTEAPVEVGIQYTDRPDIEAAIDRMGRTLGIKRELKNLYTKLDADEKVIELARVERNGHGCLLVVTARRLMFLREGMIRVSIEEIPIRAITSVGSKRRLTNGRLLVTVAGNAEVWPMTSATHSEIVSASIRELMRGSHAEAPTPAQPVSNDEDLASKLGKLADLHSNGLLSDSEFSAAKSRLIEG